MTTQTKRGRRTARELGDDYLELVRRFPLRPVRSERDYNAALAVLDELAVRPEGSLSRGERDYLDTLTLLVEAYDEQQLSTEAGALAPLDALKYLMEQSGTTQKQLGELLGNRALASLILNRHRALSKTHIRILSGHFKVEPGLFLGAG